MLIIILQIFFSVSEAIPQGFSLQRFEDDACKQRVLKTTTTCTTTPTETCSDCSDEEGWSFLSCHNGQIANYTSSLPHNPPKPNEYKFNLIYHADDSCSKDDSLNRVEILPVTCDELGKVEKKKNRRKWELDQWNTLFCDKDGLLWQWVYNTSDCSGEPMTRSQYEPKCVSDPDELNHYKIFGC